MASSPLPARSPRALWLRSRCCNFVLVISAGLMCSADRSVKLFPDSLRRTRLPFSLSILAMASAPSSLSLLSERSTSANDRKTSLKVLWEKSGKKDGKNGKTQVFGEQKRVKRFRLLDRAEVFQASVLSLAKCVVCHLSWYPVFCQEGFQPASINSSMLACSL